MEKTLWYLMFSFSLMLSCRASGSELSTICSPEEEQQVQTSHLQCTKQVEERYTILAGNFNPAAGLPAPSATSVSAANPFKQDHVINQICGMLHEVVEKCGQIYEKCYSAQDYRKFKDYQLEIFLQLMSSLYNLGDEVKQCDIVREYDRSGRRQVVTSTQLCKEDNVTSLTIKYQQCIEDANIEMTRQMQMHFKSVQMMFQSLCDGMHKVVHGCGDLLHECYTSEEIGETKVGQLELTKRVFDDLMRDMDADSTQFRDFSFDIGNCPIYNHSDRITATHVRTLIFILLVIVGLL